MSLHDVDAGTRMRIYLPLISTESSRIHMGAIDQVVEGHGETILLVDDNATVLETGRDVLEGLGYKVLTAVDGLTAIELYKSHATEVDLIILDLVMPNMVGVRALQAIRDVDPDAKAPFATGYDKLSSLGSVENKVK